jgi:hypothetical protein
VAIIAFKQINFKIRIIEEIDEDMQRTETRLTALTKRVNTTIKKSSGKQITTKIIIINCNDFVF